jgi:hypothetical protein
VPSVPNDRDLDSYRERADRFVAALDEEYYLHYAGLKDTLQLELIYAEYEDLTRLEAAQTIGLAVNGGRRVRELWRFACEGYLGALTREETEKTAELEATLKVELDGDEIPFRMIRPVLANTGDRDRRRRLEELRAELTEEHLNPLLLSAVETVRGETEKLGAPTYADLYRRFGFELDALADRCRAFLDSTEQLWEATGDRLFRARAGIGLAEAERWDLGRVFRGVAWDTAFPSDRMVPALESSLADLGIELRAQPNVELDLADRPNKSPRAFCVPIEVPQRVVLVIKPQGGPDDWRALFHEAGHTEHYAHTSASLSVEDRRLGDNAVTEGWAMLLEHLTIDPAWLTRRLDFPRPAEYAAEGAAQLLWLVRRYCAKLLYELEFHASSDVTAMGPRYAELLTDATKVPYTELDYLMDMDSGFYSSEYLRAWAFEAQLRGYLRETFGNDWFAKRQAGSLLRELWAEGQAPTADELLQDVAGQSLELDAVADRVREALALV